MSRGGEAARAREARAEGILQPGRTCWRVERADRVAFLVDGERYFGALASALERARHRIWLIGWDFHTDFRLRRGPGEPGLLAFLDGLLRRRDGLRIHVLEWDFAMLYSLSRQVLPSFRFRIHPRRLRFVLDGDHPRGACHHEKLVVIDDAVAFTGGLDLAPGRWDTRAHDASDARRPDAGAGRLEPFHDVGIALGGPAARALGDWARERWRRATGECVLPVAAPSDAWPDVAQPHLERVEVGIARTEPAWAGRPERREVEALYLESIRRARRSIYVENQYLCAAAIGEALCERLREKDGPEVVIVGPVDAEAWLENATMGVLRARLLGRLREADRWGRLAVVHPVVPGGARVNVHAKLMIVDDELARLGSANLANRSMGLDTELDVAIEARGEARVARAIAALRDDLLAEHLGARREQVRAAHERTGSLLAVLDELGGGERTLRPLESELADWAEDWLPDERVLDPARPLCLDDLSAALLPEPPVDERRRRGLGGAAAVALVLLALAGLWHWAPVSGATTPEELASFGRALREPPAGPLLAALAIAAAGALFVPITALVVASALVYGPWLGFGVALAGALGAALLGWSAGRVLWRDTLHRLMTPRLHRLSEAIAVRGVLAVAAVRVIPLAPFALVNVAAGVSHVRLRDFVVGSALAMAPGIVLLGLFADRLRRAVIDPGWGSALVLAALVALLAGAGAWFHRRRRRAEAEPSDAP
jgi:phospholipase D1/2